MTESAPKIAEDLVQMARVALAGRAQDVQALVHRYARRYRKDVPELAVSLTELLRQSPTRASPLRKGGDVALPVDVDSRFQLLLIEETPFLDHEPVFDDSVAQALDALMCERREEGLLREAGLEPVRTAIFTGPPGVGKTLAARWLARELGRPLLILDLSAVMSSYLGRTGANLRHVLDYAKSMDCVLLLDELDAIAKRRDDQGEVGELKRLVTVLLQQLDDWPAGGLLIAATNHSDLLDPAVWRRFEVAIRYDIPSREAVRLFIETALDGLVDDARLWAGVLAVALGGNSFSEIDRRLKAARRAAALRREALDVQLTALLELGGLEHGERIALATSLTDSGVVTQRQAAELTGISRDTIRSHSAHGPAKPGRRRKVS